MLVRRLRTCTSPSSNSALRSDGGKERPSIRIPFFSTCLKWMLMASQNKIALVTGAGSGIGRAASLALHSAGYSVVLVGRRVEQLNETAARIRTSDAKVLVAPCDVSQPDRVRALFATTKEIFGRL